MSFPFFILKGRMKILYDNIELVKRYKKVVDDNIDNIMANNDASISTLTWFKELWKTSNRLQECIEKYENPMVMTTEEDKSYYDKYIEHKMKYRETMDEQHKEEMIKELNCILEEYNKVFNEIMQTGFDVPEERMLVKEFSKNIYNRA